MVAVSKTGRVVQALAYQGKTGEVKPRDRCEAAGSRVSSDSLSGLRDGDVLRCSESNCHSMFNHDWAFQRYRGMLAPTVDIVQYCMPSGTGI